MLAIALENRANPLRSRLGRRPYPHNRLRTGPYEGSRVRVGATLAIALVFTGVKTSLCVIICLRLLVLRSSRNGVS
jgi:hypothetical protein